MVQDIKKQKKTHQLNFWILYHFRSMTHLAITKRVAVQRDPKHPSKIKEVENTFEKISKKAKTCQNFG